MAFISYILALDIYYLDLIDSYDLNLNDIIFIFL